MLSFTAARAEGQAYCAAIRSLLALADAEKVQEEISKQLAEAGYAEDSAYFSKGAESLNRVLDEAEMLTRGVRLSAEEFSSLLSESLKSLEISLIPQFTDAVFVGSLSESKKSAGKVLFGRRAHLGRARVGRGYRPHFRSGYRPPAHAESGDPAQDT